MYKLHYRPLYNHNRPLTIIYRPTQADPPSQAIIYRGEKEPKNIMDIIKNALKTFLLSTKKHNINLLSLTLRKEEKCPINTVKIVALSHGFGHW